MSEEVKKIIDNLNEDKDYDDYVDYKGSYFKPLLDYITNLQHQLVYCLKYESGAGIRDCKMALEKCDYNYNTAYKYLRLISDGVARWKIVDGQRIKWTDEDYIKCARGDDNE